MIKAKKKINSYGMKNYEMISLDTIKGTSGITFYLMDDDIVPPKPYTTYSAIEESSQKAIEVLRNRMLLNKDGSVFLMPDHGWPLMVTMPWHQEAWMVGCWLHKEEFEKWVLDGKIEKKQIAKF
jgi:hypothetical protein